MSSIVHKRFTCRHCAKDISVDGNKYVHEGQRAFINQNTQGVEIFSFTCNLCQKINICVTTKHYGVNMLEVKSCKGKVCISFACTSNKD